MDAEEEAVEEVDEEGLPVVVVVVHLVVVVRDQDPLSVQGGSRSVLRLRAQGLRAGCLSPPATRLLGGGWVGGRETGSMVPRLWGADILQLVALAKARPVVDSLSFSGR